MPSKHPSEPVKYPQDRLQELLNRTQTILYGPLQIQKGFVYTSGLEPLLVRQECRCAAFVANSRCRRPGRFRMLAVLSFPNSSVIVLRSCLDGGALR